MLCSLTIMPPAGHHIETMHYHKPMTGHPLSHAVLVILTSCHDFAVSLWLLAGCIQYRPLLHTLVLFVRWSRCSFLGNRFASGVIMNECMLVKTKKNATALRRGQPAVVDVHSAPYKHCVAVRILLGKLRS